MYKTAVYAIVDGGITHEKQQVSKMWYYVAWLPSVNVGLLLSNITFVLKGWNSQPSFEQRQMVQKLWTTQLWSKFSNRWS